jgi:hypothetical protein
VKETEGESSLFNHLEVSETTNQIPTSYQKRQAAVQSQLPASYAPSQKKIQKNTSKVLSIPLPKREITNELPGVFQTTESLEARNHFFEVLGAGGVYQASPLPLL